MFVEIIISRDAFSGNISAKAILTIINSNFHIKKSSKTAGSDSGRIEKRNTDDTDYTDKRGKLLFTRGEIKKAVSL